MGLVYGYARCSTDEKRQNIDRQRRELHAMGAEDSRIYWEYESGTRRDRPELEKLLAVVKTGDTICATEVSRLSRSTRQLCNIIETARDRHLRLLIGSLDFDCRADKPDAMTATMLQVMGAFAELEREMISQRVKSGIANAVQKGKKPGRPKLTAATLPKAFLRHVEDYKEGRMSVTELAKVCDVSRPAIYRYLDVLGVPYGKK